MTIDLHQAARLFRFVPVCVALFAAAASADDGAMLISDAVADATGKLVHRIRSPYQADETEVQVLLPSALQHGERCRVLFVLPVEPGAGQRWGDPMLELQKAQVPDRHRLICVYPTFADWPWYADHPSNLSIRQESYLLQVVLPFVDRTYPTQSHCSGRLLVGFSKSGWGAFSLLLRHPGTFGRAAAWDAPLNKQAPDQFGMGSIFGTQENFAAYQLSRLLAERAANVQDGQRLIHLGFGNFREHHRAFESLLLQHGISHIFHDGPQREHNWTSGWLSEAIHLLANEQASANQ
jgi:hypothetical protein